MAKLGYVGSAERTAFIAIALGALISSACGASSDDPLSGPAGGVSSGGGTSGTSGTLTGGSGPNGGGGSSPTGTGASPSTGTSGSPSGGSTTPDPGSSAEPGSGSSGCGAERPLESGRYSIDIDGTEREYVLDVPSNYDTNHPYRLIFGWHWVGATANDVVTGELGDYGGLGPYYGLQARAEDTAIFVAPEGIDTGWANPDDRDIVFLRGMLQHFNSTLCIDPERIFSTGFSFGGMMSIAVGCEMGDVFRAIAPMSGSTRSGCNEDKTDPIAFWGATGDVDTDIPPEFGHVARDIFLARNHCQEQTTPVDPSPCVTYEGCDAGYPVQWCEFSGDHTQWSSAPEPLWQFFSQF